MTRYEQIACRLETRRPALERELQRLVVIIGHAIGDRLPQVEPLLAGRVKSAPSLWLKMQRYALPYDEIHDLLGIRVIVPQVRDCYRAAAVIRQLWPGRCTHERDYIRRPKESGYRSLHVCVQDDRWPRFEVQIRTPEMDRACTCGAAAHERYKAAAWRAFLALWSQSARGGAAALRCPPDGALRGAPPSG